MDAPIRAADRSLPKDIQASAHIEIDRLERRLELFKAKAEALRPLVTATNGRYDKIVDTIEDLEDKIDTLRQGQLAMDL